MLSYTNAIIALIVLAGIVMLGSAVLNLNTPQQTIQQNNSVGLQNTQENYQEFVSAELADKCAVPEGYTEEKWKEHMSHHPDRYEGCL
ncbi:MAG: hypothetical protein ABIH20_01710 [Candidatus Diapherotrites archaeon]